MGTRGSWGFRLNDQDKVTYNHWDSYPTSLGIAVVEFVKAVANDELMKIASRTKLVDEGDEAPPELIEKYRDAYADTNVSSGGLEEWYVLLRKAQGKPDAYRGKLEHMIDGSSFLADSLLCEWAYVINMDNHMLEVYKGFNQDINAPGRYASLKPEEDYHGVALVLETPFEQVRGLQDVAGWAEDTEGAK